MNEPKRVLLPEVRARWPRALEYIAVGVPKGEFYVTVTLKEDCLWNLHPDGTWYLWGSDGWSMEESPYASKPGPEKTFGLDLTRDQAEILLRLVETYHDEDMPLCPIETDEMRLVRGLMDRLNFLLKG